MMSQSIVACKAEKNQAAAWIARADELTEWAKRTLCLRSDTYPTWTAAGWVRATWTDDEGARSPVELTDEALRQHFWGNAVIGTYTLDRDNTCSHFGVDVDAHDGQEADPQANLAYVLTKYDGLRELDTHPLLVDSNGKGGYHLLVRFPEPVDGGTAHSISHWLVRDAPTGMHVEAFPKKPRLATGGCGNQLRLPGKHHKRDHWTRIWDGGQWLEGDEAIDAILRWEATDPAAFPQEARNFIPPRPEQMPSARPATTEGNGDGHWLAQFDGDLRTLDMVKLCEDRLTGESWGERQYGIVCPWSDQHTTGDGGTCIWTAADGDYPGFNCLHASHGEKTIQDLLEWYGAERVDACCSKTFGQDRRLDATVEETVKPAVLPQASGDNDKATEPAKPAENGQTTAEFVSEIAGLTKGKGTAKATMPKWTEGVSAADLDSENIDLEFLVEKLLTVMPTVIGGRFKSLKTLVMLDLAISLASGTKFLNRWQCRKVSVALWSGESGRAVIQNAVRRISASKGISPPAGLTLHFCLPQLHDENDVRLLAELIRRDGRKAVFLDPAYLCLLDRDTAGKASNVFVMGNALRPVTEVIGDTGCLVGLCHHFGKWTASNADYSPPELGELSQAGMAEWAGNWLLLSRRAPYLDDGQHKLYLTAGNRCGQAYRLAVDVDEGPMDERGTFRTAWKVRVDNLTAAQVADKLERVEVRATDREEKVLTALAKLGRKATATEVSQIAGIRRGEDGPKPILDLLAGEGKVLKTVGTNRQNREVEYYELAKGR
jgi:hypothetical protein